MNKGETITSEKDGKPEILVLQADGSLTGNRTGYIYQKPQTRLVPGVNK